MLKDDQPAGDHVPQADAPVVNAADVPQPDNRGQRLAAAADTLRSAAKPVLVTLLFVAIAAFAANCHGRSKANRWLTDTLQANVFAPEKEAVAQSQIHSASKLRLVQQLQDVRRRASYHLEVMRDFYVDYYMAITMGLLLGAVAAVVLFFISKTGWAGAAAWQIAVFIVITASGTYFATLPTLYSQQDNIEQNKELYLYHRALESEILTFISTGEPSDLSRLTFPSQPEGTPLTAERVALSFVHYVDRRMTELHKLPLGFDYTRLPAEYLSGVPTEGGGQTGPPTKESPPTR